jgi:hypothetical protein
MAAVLNTRSKRWFSVEFVATVALPQRLGSADFAPENDLFPKTLPPKPKPLRGAIKRMTVGGRFLTKGLNGAQTEMALSVLAYDILRAISVRAALA